MSVIVFYSLGTAPCLVLNLEAPQRASSYSERIVTYLTRRERKEQTQSEMVGMSTGTPAHLVNAPTIAESVLKSTPKRVRYEAERIQEIALSGSIRSHKKGKRSELNVARSDTLVVLEDNSC